MHHCKLGFSDDESTNHSEFMAHLYFSLKTVNIKSSR